MSQLALTPERRAQLAELLGNERRLEAEYPAVAEYLDTAPSLPGTGNDEADRAFDLRLLHFMTEDEPGGSNPYWEIVAPSVFERNQRRVVDGGKAEGSARLAYAQTLLQATYAYAIPSPLTIQWLAQFSDGKPVIEIGAGRGYWAAQISRAGLKIDAYDLEPPDVTDNPSFPSSAGRVDVWHPVGSSNEFNTRMRDAADSVLLLCWPPGWGSSMAVEALELFAQMGGTRLVYVGEPKGGKTASEGFFHALNKCWHLSEVDEGFVSWWNLSDAAQGWTRR